jgi:3-hydroxymyristoyl/3-hydroxydecanoyl-(acyl carrier protein) dehydratase
MRPAPDLLTPFEWVLTQVGPDTVVTDIDPGSAVFAGHYPGRPLVPAVCLIDLVRRVAEELDLAHRGEALLVHRARFVDAVLPGDQLTVTVTAGGDGQLVSAVRHSRGLACQIRLGAASSRHD